MLFFSSDITRNPTFFPLDILYLKHYKIKSFLPFIMNGFK